MDGSVCRVAVLVATRVAAQPLLLLEPLRRLEPVASYPVEVAQSLLRLGTEVDSRLARHDKAPS